MTENKTEKIDFRCSQEFFNLVDKEAKRTGKSRGQVIIDCVTNWLKKD